MRKVLLVINNDAFGKQMARWALAIKRHGRWEPIVYIGADHIERHVAACREEGIVILSSNVLASRKFVGGDKAIQSQTILSNSWKMIFHYVHRGLLRFLQVCRKGLFPLQVFYTIGEITRQLRIVRYLIRQNQVSALIISESSPAYGAPVYIQAAHQEHVPVVTVPVEKFTVHDYAEMYLSDSGLSLECPINRLIAGMYPAWVIEHKGQKMVRVGPNLIFALERLGIRPPHPWQMVDNLEDIIAVDSQISLNHYIAEGVPAWRMKVVGNAEQDIIYNVQRDARGLKSSLLKSLGMPHDRPMLLSALVQNHFLSGRPECDFQDYETMVEFWVRSLGMIDGYNVVINLHPSHSYNQDSHKWDYLEQWGVKICREDIATLIPLCDIYVAATSSTIPWAIACGKPVINYNVYRYRFSIYRNMSGVIEVQEQMDFLKALKRLTSDPLYYSKVSTYQMANGPQWGLLDGKAVERLEDLLASQVEDYLKKENRKSE